MIGPRGIGTSLFYKDRCRYLWWHVYRRSPELLTEHAHQIQPSSARGYVYKLLALRRWSSLGLLERMQWQLKRMIGTWRDSWEAAGHTFYAGEWLIRGAFRQAAHWQATGRMPFKVAVSLSPTTIQNCDLAALVSEGAEASGVCPSVLDIEVTETAVMSDFATASRALSAVRRLGVTVSLDDFGTGYSSLAYLMRLPVDRVKVDKSFVQELTVEETGRQARAMVEAIVAQARAMGMRTVAEGIETEAQLVLVKELGCDAAQGYFIGQAGIGSAHRTLRRDTLRSGAGCSFAVAGRNRRIALAANASRPFALFEAAPR